MMYFYCATPCTGMCTFHLPFVHIGLEDGDRVDDLALVHEGTGTVDSTDDVGHTSLAAEVSRSLGKERMRPEVNRDSD
jgi:hypothetical protein